MVLNYSKLRGRIVERYGTIKEFSDTVQISRTALSLSLNNKRAFSQQEMLRILELLNIQENEIGSYFFTELVQKHEPALHKATLKGKYIL